MGREIRTCSAIFFELVLLQCVVIFCASQNFDFFFLVQQWPGSACDTKRSCCYPLTGKPVTNFTIHGLWPNYNNKSWPSYCNRQNLFDYAKISDLGSRMQTNWPSLACPSSNNSKFWTHEWDRHGTCAEPVLDQHVYFETALNLKDTVDLLKVLQNANIEPAEAKVYSLESIEAAMKEGIGSVSGITCNKDATGNSQLKEINLCVDKTASKLIECPVTPNRNCRSQMQFPPF